MIAIETKRVYKNNYGLHVIISSIERKKSHVIATIVATTHWE
jgi:hypothetical protein